MGKSGEERENRDKDEIRRKTSREQENMERENERGLSVLIDKSLLDNLLPASTLS